MDSLFTLPKDSELREKLLTTLRRWDMETRLSHGIEEDIEAIRHCLDSLLEELQDLTDAETKFHISSSNQ